MARAVHVNRGVRRDGLCYPDAFPEVAPGRRRRRARRQRQARSARDRPMNIYWLRPFSFGQHTYSDTSVHKNYGTITFATRPNIDAYVWLTIVSPGAAYSRGAVTSVGMAAAGFRSYRFVNARGEIELKELDQWEAHVRVEKIVELTAAFHVRLAWAKAEGTIYYWE
jgi:hypothetical protein